MNTTGLRPDSATHFQLNAGAFLKNFDYESFKDGDALWAGILAALKSGKDILGATVGGGSFQCTPTVRQIEADGQRAPYKGTTVNDMWTVKLTGTMKEITPENFANALMCAEVKTEGKKTTIKVRNSISMEDYIPTLCWIGDMNNGGFILIALTSALNMTGANFTFTDKGEGTLPFEFQGHQDSLEDNQYAPCEIVFFDPVTTIPAAPVEG